MILKRYVCLVITFCLLLGCSNEEETYVSNTEEQAEMKTIVAVGDSLTAGYNLDESESYPALLQQKLHAAGYDYQVVNAGVSAETSSGTLSRIEWILTLQPDIVILETGANDGLRGIDPELLEQNLREILKILTEKEITVVLAGMKMVWNLGPAYVIRFNSIYPALAKEFDTVFMPFFLKGVAMKPQLNLGDGLHPNAIGYAAIAENIFPYVVEAIAKEQEYPR